MEHLRATIAFIAAAKHGSFTRAARALDVSPQAIAASVARLETVLQVRLFNRSTRAIALTEEGAQFFQRVEHGLSILEGAAQSIRDSEQQPTGLVRVSTGAAFGRRYLLSILPEFRQRFPKVQLEIVFDDRKVDLVRDGFDVAIRGGMITDSSLITRTICGLSGVMVASPDYLRRYGVPKNPEQLNMHRIIQLRFSSGITAPWNLRVKDKLTSFECEAPALVLSDTESVADAAALGMGIARASLHFAWAHLQAGRLLIVLNSVNDPGTREMVLHYPHRAHLAPRVKAFIDYALERLRAIPALQATPKSVLQFCA